MELQQITDFRAEAAELHQILAPLVEADWRTETQFKQWTINDVVLHLHIADKMALLSATDEAAYDALVADIQAQRARGMGWKDYGRYHLPDLTGPRLLACWREYLTNLCDVLAAKPVETRFKWSGPGMGLRMFATARQMETWAHGQTVYDVLGVERPPASPRLRNIAEIGVRTFAWAYRNRGVEVPAVAPFIRLETPFGEVWEWNEYSEADAVTGRALEFCQVVTQTRNVADTDLRVSGETAQDWMRIVQCFAGGPETPPAPGTRYRAGV